MRLVLAVAFASLFVACASRPVRPATAFDFRPRYPITVIPLSPALSLRHVAGAPCDYNSDVRPQIGSEGTRTFSTYELIGADGTKLFTAPSMLSDPQRELAEFRAYYRANDQITVLTSNSKNTILIVEDRSPAYPDRAHILLRRTSDATWSWSQLKVPTFPRYGPPPEKSFAQVVGLSDTTIWFRAEGRTWSQPLNEATQGPNQALQRTVAGRRGSNRRVSWPPSLSFGR